MKKPQVEFTGTVNRTLSGTNQRYGTSRKTLVGLTRQYNTLPPNIINIDIIQELIVL